MMSPIRVRVTGAALITTITGVGVFIGLHHDSDRSHLSIANGSRVVGVLVDGSPLPGSAPMLMIRWTRGSTMVVPASSHWPKDGVWLRTVYPTSGAVVVVPPEEEVHLAWPGFNATLSVTNAQGQSLTTASPEPMFRAPASGDLTVDVTGSVKVSGDNLAQTAEGRYQFTIRASDTTSTRAP